MIPIGIVFKQWYKSRNQPKTPMLNAKHLRYIATRKGVIPNEGYGFGLWGRIGESMVPGDINNLRDAMALVRKVSKDHTVYRSIVSLDEETAQAKGYVGREEWQALVCSHIAAIAKENGIEQKDVRWCAAYHHEKGHPHAHIVFWDSSDRVREEYMGDERFEIAMEKIRASFNGEIFKAELQSLRETQDETKKELRLQSRNVVEGYGNLTFFAEGETESKQAEAVNFYPKGLKVAQAQELCSRLEELLYLLPEKGQLKYQYLSREARQAVDLVSACLMKHTTLGSLCKTMLQTSADIAATYGNAPKAVERQRKLAEGRMIKDIGNDVLATLRKEGWLEHRRQERKEELADYSHTRIFDTAEKVLTEKFSQTPFIEQFEELKSEMGRFCVPRHVAMQSQKTSDSLHSLTIECMKEKGLQAELRISEGFSKQQTGTEEENQERKEAYRYVFNTLYSRAEKDLGWDTQRQQGKAISFLAAFCRVVSGNNRLIGHSGRYLFRKKLSKQAKKERYLSQKDTNQMWEAETWF